MAIGIEYGDMKIYVSLYRRK